MTKSAIQPMHLGEYPTEPGWYVCSDGRERHVCEVIREGSELWMYVIGNELGSKLNRHSEWIARIHLENIAEPVA